MKISEVTDMLGFTNTRKEGTEAADKASTVDFDPTKLGPKETYYSWQGYARPAQKGFNKKLLRSFTIIGIVVVLVFLILQEYFLIVLIASLIFVSHVLSKTPPTLIRYEASSHGVSIDGEIYYWPEINRFFFTTEEGHVSLVLDMARHVPSRLFLTISEKDIEKLKQIFNDHTHFLEVAPESFLDKTYNSIFNKFEK
jgi:hypothetical protein